MQLLITGNPAAPDAGAAATAANGATAANAATAATAAAAAQTSADPGAEATSTAPVAAAAAHTLSALPAAVQFSAPQAAATPATPAPAAADDADSDSDADAHPGGALTGAARTALPDALAAAAARAFGTSESNSSSGGNGGEPGASADGGNPFALAAATTAASTADNAAAAATSSAAQVPGAVTAQLHGAVGSNAWANELGARVHWMAEAGISSASLRLTPEQLGPVEVKISVHENAASVWFNAAQPETRTALEQALPRLRELFASQGMNLAQAGVSDQSARGAEQRSANTLTPRSLAARAASATSVTAAVRTHQGLIDTYA
jgi:flagellar hook-length control protein FliK